MNKKYCWLILTWLIPLAGAAPGWSGETPPPDSGVIYRQPAAASGTLLQSSRWVPDDSDYDVYVWDSFTLDKNQTIGEITWRGGYDPSKARIGGKVLDFQLCIYGSIPAGTQPDVVHAPLAEYRTGDKAGEKPAGTVGTTAMYDYRFVLPVPFVAVAGTKYWLRVEALQDSIPHWGIASGTGGDGKYFRSIAGVGDFFYQSMPGDAAFTLIQPPENGSGPAAQTGGDPAR